MNTLRVNIDLQRDRFELCCELELPAAGIAAVYGPSGCGKSTLMKCIAGLVRPRGHVALGDALWQDTAQQLFVPPHQRPLGFVFQEPRLFPHLDVAANLAFGVRYRNLKLDSDHYAETLDLLDLEPLLSRNSLALSGGEARRVAIARALLTQPDLLLMDEPMAGLDAARRSELLPYLERMHLARQVPILYVTHQMDEVMRLADHLVVMHNGMIQAAGPFAEAANACPDQISSVSALDCRFTQYHTEDRLLELEFEGGKLLASGARPDIGSAMRALVMARDVSLTLSMPRDTSILNVLSGRVASLEARANSVMVTVSLGVSALIRSEISHRSARVLGLERGTPVYAQVKALSLQHARGG